MLSTLVFQKLKEAVGRADLSHAKSVRSESHCSKQGCPGRLARNPKPFPKTKLDPRSRSRSRPGKIAPLPPGFPGLSRNTVSKFQFI